MENFHVTYRPHFYIHEKVSVFFVVKWTRTLVLDIMRENSLPNWNELDKRSLATKSHFHCNHATKLCAFAALTGCNRAATGDCILSIPHKMIWKSFPINLCSHDIEATKFEVNKFLILSLSTAAKTLAIIVGLFILCWLPFFTFYIISPFCDNCINELLFSVVFWIGNKIWIELHNIEWNSCGNWIIWLNRAWILFSIPRLLQ